MKTDTQLHALLVKSIDDPNVINLLKCEVSVGYVVYGNFITLLDMLLQDVTKPGPETLRPRRTGVPSNY